MKLKGADPFETAPFIFIYLEVKSRDLVNSKLNRLFLDLSRHLTSKFPNIPDFDIQLFLDRSFPNHPAESVEWGEDSDKVQYHG